MEVTWFIWSYCRDMKKIIIKSGISLNAGTLNRGFTVFPIQLVVHTFFMFFKICEKYQTDVRHFLLSFFAYYCLYALNHTVILLNFLHIGSFEKQWCL
jgi:hypothetical protein